MNSLLLNMLIGALISAAKASGRDAVVRMLTIPAKDMQKYTKNAPDPAESIRLQHAWAEAGADFFMSLLPDQAR